jgi:predicted dehydrogenase
MGIDHISRRSFVSSMATSAFAFTIVPRHVLGGPGYTAPSDRVNFAVIGTGGQGLSNATDAVGGNQNLVALADIDFGFVDRQVAGIRDTIMNGAPNVSGLATREAYGKAKRYADFRVMLEKERNNIDGVIIATPDHTHAVAAVASMQMGKAVYVQKPLTWSVLEARTLAATAQRTGVVTQMGNQGHSGDGTRQINEWIQAGVIGPVREVHVWTNRPIWPQGIPRPTTLALRSQTLNPTVVPPPVPAGGAPPRPAGPVPPPQTTWENVRNAQQPMAAAMAGNYPVPPGVNWDLFIGPSQMVPYHPLYHPFNWRGWTDWGVGALGDMGAHLIDQPFWALNLGLPISVEATSTPFGMDVDDTPATYPQAMTAHYEFAARGDQPAVKMTWYDGGLMPPRPEHLPEELVLDRSGGGIFVGTKGILLYSTYGNNPTLFPESLRETAARVPRTIERVPTNHVINWANAIMGKAKPSSSFDYASRLTETMILGMVALKTGQGRKIVYDAENMRITNIPEANQLLHREYRAGWSL